MTLLVERTSTSSAAGLQYVVMNLYFIYSYRTVQKLFRVEVDQLKTLVQKCNTIVFVGNGG